MFLKKQQWKNLFKIAKTIPAAESKSFSRLSNKE